MLTLKLAVEGSLLRVGVANRSKQPVTVATLLRYLTVEIKGARGEFVRGESVGATSLPSRSDYRLVAASQVDESVFELPISTADDRLRIGDVEFPTSPARTEVRVTYKADGIMPNLPSKQQHSLVRGPLQSTTVIGPS